MCGVVRMALMGGAAAVLKRGDGVLARAFYRDIQPTGVIVLYVGE